ncbi:GNAT family N-acetyltransferase [Undibacterium pigrum]|uniref:Acetyltransferase (GNAT) family protein n=1 Tax=Undibacterium pigrum TaxID=401470 RepID=A0A318JCC8_9BURK|nr:GNAT family N-acetyltransferase [Undibacterium pigrum]PXX45246.1 acetyltransferase (GNAT) family protein [Undibacterium pigrum]
MTLPLLIIRRAHPQEAQALTLIARQSKAHWKYPASALQAWEAQLTITSEHIEENSVWLAEHEQAILGFYHLSSADTQCDLADLFVLPEAMGQGIGRSLLQHAMENASDLGQRKMTIDADPYAEKFYLSMGAVRVGELTAPIEGDPERVRPQLILLLDNLMNAE